MNREERKNLIDLLRSDNDDDYKLASIMIDEMNLDHGEKESICIEAETDSKFYIIPTRNLGIIRVKGFWNKIDTIWKDKKSIES